MKKITPESGFWAIIVGLGLLWIKSGWSKILGGTFAQTLDQTLLLFAQGNPNNPQLSAGNPYGWYREFLLQVAVPNSYLMGLSVQWGELLVGLGLVGLPLAYFLVPSLRRLILVLLSITAFSGFMLNISLWLASAWTSASTEMVGLLMMIIEAIAFLVFLSMLRTTEKRDDA